MWGQRGLAQRTTYLSLKLRNSCMCFKCWLTLYENKLATLIHSRPDSMNTIKMLRNSVRYCRVPSPAIGNVLLAMIKRVKNVNRHSFIQNVMFSLFWLNVIMFIKQFSAAQTDALYIHGSSKIHRTSWKFSQKWYWELLHLLYAFRRYIYIILLSNILLLWDIPETRRVH